MKLGLPHTKTLLAGLMLIVVTNAVVLAGVAYNRSGEPESVLELTERELRIYNWDWPANENSSIDVHLDWRVRQTESIDDDSGGAWYQWLSWLQPAQLREFGFDVSGDVESEETRDRIHRQPARSAWLALEYDGAAYQAAVARALRGLERATALAAANPGDKEFRERLEAARGEVAREERFASRLFVVDASVDGKALRARYPNRQQHLIVRGRLELRVEGESGLQRLIAHAAGVDVGTIRVPHSYREIVEPFTRPEHYRNDREPRFSATVRFGRRFEPWIVALAPLN